MISLQDLFLVSALNVAMIVVGVIIHNRWIDRKLAAPKKPNNNVGGNNKP